MEVGRVGGVMTIRGVMRGLPGGELGSGQQQFNGFVVIISVNVCRTMSAGP
jgi:hypothetical protein